MHPTVHRFTIGLPDHIGTIGDSTFDAPHIFRDVPWGSPVSFGEIIIGNGQETAMANATFSIITNKLLRIPNLAGILVSAFSLETVRSVQYNSIVHQHLLSSTAFVQIRVDGLTSESVAHILCLENLEVLCLLAPSTNVQEPANLYDLRYVERLLCNASDLQGISMPFVMSKDSAIIFKALRRATNLKTINIAGPVTPLEFKLASDLNVLSAFTKGIESLTELRKVSFPSIIVDFEPLRKVLQRLSN